MKEASESLKLIIFSATGTFSCSMTRLSQTLAACCRAVRSSEMRHKTSCAIRRRLGGRSVRHSRFRPTDSRSRSRRLRSLRTRRSNWKYNFLRLASPRALPLRKSICSPHAPKLLLLLQQTNLIHVRQIQAVQVAAGGADPGNQSDQDG